MRRALFACLVVSMAAAAAAATASTPKTTLVGDCVHAQVKPPRVIFTCADGTFYASGLHWSHWGSTRAQASGTAHVNNCTPSCAQGHFHSYPVKVTASRRRHCADGRNAYTRVRYAFPQHSPFSPGSQATKHPYASRPCK